jgi:hypothetical protein
MEDMAMPFFDKEDWLYDDADDAYASGHDEGFNSGVGNRMAHGMGFQDGQHEKMDEVRKDFQTFDNAVAPSDSDTIGLDHEDEDDEV